MIWKYLEQNVGNICIILWLTLDTVVFTELQGITAGRQLDKNNACI